ncbi:FdhF/YdeP family oxidoreductase [Pseudokineococcus lusitanus]|jgi:formate dehydrogenase major subunit|uniref:Formate dehydrogenase major subunit n=1 Tax=Pseudokineococcus lusitanus TaxID=763993 RepID=A0A3N1HL17_9ACTN|nr:FdhF/YdeP family oxidoreductase [Pseudokineococcus lusitanus]ROP43141.1 formate dehydrogenase major subunit [Pseudokineococcus lusitanus]
MATDAPVQDIDGLEIERGHIHSKAAGATAVAVALSRSVEQMGVVRTARTLARLNQVDGFDCTSCAWPDPATGERHLAEFCENGAKAVAEEATLRRIGPEFFARHSISELAGRTDYWLGQQGRLTHPVVKRAGSDHYEAISWDDAFALVADRLAGLGSPDEAVFYTSGRTSNEAAFLYQTMIRAYGTNNLPDCSNMCHESTSVALAETIGIGKGSVSLKDVQEAGLVVIAGQNPGTNHPRMLSALEIAKKNGAKILAVNPLPETGLMGFKNPQHVGGVVKGVDLADEYLPIRIGGDMALWQAVGHLLLRWDSESRAAGGPGVVDHDFLAQHTVGFESYAEGVRDLDWDLVDRATGLSREQVVRAAEMFRDSPATVVCWAMGVTQHRHAVATIKEIVNVCMLKGDIGRPGAGLCPVRGHSNVQGDRTMGIWEKVPDHFLDALGEEFGFEPPRKHGHDTVDSIRALRDGEAHVFFAMGGNFVAAAPDTDVVEAAMRKARLTVQVSTKLNHSHAVCGEEALILPVLGRTERDLTGGREQAITVEDSMSAVHASRGRLAPASPHLRSEVDVVCSLGEALAARLADRPGAGNGAALAGIDWAGFRSDYTNVRRSIARVVPSAAAYAEKVERPGGFVLPHPPRDSRTFPTKEGKAVMTTSPLDLLEVPEGKLLLQTLRSHDQFNTTIYGLDDRYRGIKLARRVVMMNEADIAAHGLVDGQVVDIASHWEGEDDRWARDFRVVAYPTPVGCVASYYPESNPLVPLSSTAEGSNSPTSKSVVVSLHPARSGGRHQGTDGEMRDTGDSMDGHARRDDVQPHVPS